MWQAERDDPGSAAHWIDVSIRIAGPLDAAVDRARCPGRRCSDTNCCAQPSGLRLRRRRSLSQVILDSYVPDVPILEAVPGRGPTLAATRNGETSTPGRHFGPR